MPELTKDGDAAVTIKSAILGGIASKWDQLVDIAEVRNAVFRAIFDESIQWALVEYLQLGETEKCFACGGKFSERRESLSKGLCNTLLKFFKASNGDNKRPLHIRKYTLNGVRYFETAETTNFQKLQYFGLARPSNVRGYWHLTEHGIRFVKGQVASPKNVYVRNNQIKRVGSEMVTIGLVTEIPYWLEKDDYAK